MDAEQAGHRYRGAEIMLDGNARRNGLLNLKVLQKGDILL